MRNREIYVWRFRVSLHDEIHKLTKVTDIVLRIAVLHRRTMKLDIRFRVKF